MDLTLTRKNFLLGAAVAVGTVSAAPSAAKAAPLRKGALGKYVGELAPGRYDAHIHVFAGEPDPQLLANALAAAKLTGGCIFSQSPVKRNKATPDPLPPEKAMDNCIAWASGSPSIYPFYYIDPAAPNACDLVDMAVEKGMYGFKVIRGDGPPCDEKTIPVYQKIAAAGKPLTFHSGILWDGCPSSDYFRPVNWEKLLACPGLRFALAHISWPWCDECIAVYGKLLNAIGRNGSAAVPEMFIDTTPGTPKIYRRDALSKVYTVGYDVFDHVMFGSDCRTTKYNGNWSMDWRKTDDAIYAELGLGEEWIESIYRNALRRYLFGGDEVDRRPPTADGLPAPKI